MRASSFLSVAGGGDGGAGDGAALDLTPGDGRPGGDGSGDADPAGDLGDDGPRADAAVVVPGTWVLITGGSFTMGSPDSDPCREIGINKKETEHLVTLKRDFVISDSEVTQDQFKTVMGYNPSSFDGCGGSCPVEHLSWHEAVAYCNALSAMAGFDKCYSCTGSDRAVSCTEHPSYVGAAIYGCPGYRLPTEAEWEYACRAGTTTALYNGALGACSGSDANADLIAWYAANAGSTTHAVRGKDSNDSDLFDMAGNVWEWCHDRYVGDLGSDPQEDPWGPATGSSRVGRGGGWTNGPNALRCAERGYWLPGSPASIIGFRCVRTK